MFNLKFNKKLSITQGRTRLGGVTRIWFLNHEGHEGHEEPPSFVSFVVTCNPGFTRVETHGWKGKIQVLWETESAVAVFLPVWYFNCLMFSTDADEFRGLPTDRQCTKNRYETQANEAAKSMRHRHR
jgi:hypothetical protein